jgi:hypothetical protein
VNAELQAVADALADLADAELKAVVVAANELLLVAAGLLSWVEHAADWELKRRAGLNFPLQPPAAAIPPDATIDSVVAATMIRDGFAESSGQESHPVVALFDAIVNAINGREVLQSASSLGRWSS